MARRAGRQGPRTTLYNRFVRWRAAGVWDRLLAAVSAPHDGDIVMIDASFLGKHGFRSQIHHRKPVGRPMAPHIRRSNTGRPKVRAAVEHVFARQKGGMDLFVRTVGVARAKMKIGMANLVYNSGMLTSRFRNRDQEFG